MAVADSAGVGRPTVTDSSTVTMECIWELFDHCFKNSYKANGVDRKLDIVQMRCLSLLNKDYGVNVISNKNGALCNHYPVNIYVPYVRRLNGEERGRHSFLGEGNIETVREVMASCKLARCRQRFVVPAIWFSDTDMYICRSATLSSAPEITMRTGMEWFSNTFFSGENDVEKSLSSRQDLADTNSHKFDANDMMTKIRQQDIKLMKFLRVSLICDLMVENRMVRYFVPVTSSEKADRAQRYQNDFHLTSMPYPGCEFFKMFKGSGYSSKGLHYDWSQPMNDADFSIPQGLSNEGVMWGNYQEWDIVELTQNYLKFLLQSIASGNGVLIHCVSGWDRTPLFVSLLRLSLWADGKVHQSLCAMEILYFTVAYDWLLFGHQFLERMSKGEAIFPFCFDFLQYITSDEYAVRCSRRNSDGILFHTDSDLALNNHGHCADDKWDTCCHETTDDCKSDGLNVASLHPPTNGLPQTSSDPLNITGSMHRQSPSQITDFTSESYGSWQVVSSSHDSKKFTALSDACSLDHQHDSTCELTSRGRKLLAVKKLFWDAYGNPEDSPAASSVTRSFTGLLNKLASSVVGGGSNPS